MHVKNVCVENFHSWVSMSQKYFKFYLFVITNQFFFRIESIASEMIGIRMWLIHVFFEDKILEILI